MFQVARDVFDRIQLRRMSRQALQGAAPSLATFAALPRLGASDSFRRSNDRRACSKRAEGPPLSNIPAQRSRQPPKSTLAFSLSGCAALHSRRSSVADQIMTPGVATYPVISRRGGPALRTIIELFLRALGRNGFIKISLCVVDSIYVPLRVDEGSLSLGLHPIHL
jgi:hypothetical protein